MTMRLVVVFLKSEGGGKHVPNYHSVEIHDDTTVFDVKKAMTTVLNLPPDHLSFVFNGQQHCDDKKLKNGVGISSPFHKVFLVKKTARTTNTTERRNEEDATSNTTKTRTDQEEAPPLTATTSSNNTTGAAGRKATTRSSTTTQAETATATPAEKATTKEGADPATVATTLEAEKATTNKARPRSKQRATKRSTACKSDGPKAGRTLRSETTKPAGRRGTTTGPKPKAPPPEHKKAEVLTEKEQAALLKRGLFKPLDRDLKKAEYWTNLYLVPPEKKSKKGEGEWKTSDAVYAYCKPCNKFLDYHWRSNSKSIAKHWNACPFTNNIHSDDDVDDKKSAAKDKNSTEKEKDKKEAAEPPCKATNPTACICSSQTKCVHGKNIAAGTTDTKCGACQKWMHPIGCSGYLKAAICIPCVEDIAAPSVAAATATAAQTFAAAAAAAAAVQNIAPPAVDSTANNPSNHDQQINDSNTTGSQERTGSRSDRRRRHRSPSISASPRRHRGRRQSRSPSSRSSSSSSPSCSPSPRRSDRSERRGRSNRRNRSQREDRNTSTSRRSSRGQDKDGRSSKRSRRRY